MPTEEPMVIQIQFVSPDGTLERGPRIIIGGSPALVDTSRARRLSGMETRMKKTAPTEAVG
jgi:hypothetical protein